MVTYLPLREIAFVNAVEEVLAMRVGVHASSHLGLFPKKGSPAL
jgi:hypothetical protein